MACASNYKICTLETFKVASVSVCRKLFDPIMYGKHLFIQREGGDSATDKAYSSGIHLENQKSPVITGYYNKHFQYN